MSSTQPMWGPLAQGLSMDWREWVLPAISPLFFGAMAIEAWLARRRPAPAPRTDPQRPVYERQDTWASLWLGAQYSALEVLWLQVLIWPAMAWVAAHGLPRLEMTPLAFVALYLGVDALYYAFHRASHRIRWFWCAHAVHHASEHMNLSTAMRQSALYAFAGHWAFYLPLVWLGFDARWVWLALSLNLAYQFFVHTQMVGRLHPWVEAIFNTPSHHRVHHGRNPAYIDCNYGGTLIAFDRLFGSFVPETEPVDYGLVHPVRSFNPVWLTVHDWVALARDVARPGPWFERLKHIWAPPEWTRPPEVAPQGRRARDNPRHASERPV